MPEYPLGLPDSLPELSALKYLGEKEKGWLRSYYRMIPKLPVLTDPGQFNRVQFSYQPRTINSDLAPLIKLFEPPLIMTAGILSDETKDGFPPNDEDTSQLRKEAGFGFAKLLGIMESMAAGDIHWRDPIWYTIDDDILVKRTEFSPRPDYFRIEFFPAFRQLVLRWNQFYPRDFDNLLAHDYTLSSELRFRLTRQDKLSGDLHLLLHVNRLIKPGNPAPDRNFGRVWGYNPDGSNARINIAKGSYPQLVDLEQSFMRALNVSFMYHQPEFKPSKSEIRFNVIR